MCLCPITIPNQQYRISKDGGTPIYVTVPCGKCAECQTTKQNEYFVRALFEADKCLKNNGYIYFDTLTYSDANLPHISDVVPGLPKDLDFARFNYHHVRLFLALLRKRLNTWLLSHGYNDGISNHLRYFISSEYGTSDFATHRPHYHILLYVNAPLPLLQLSRFVSDCWPHGRTDGLRYKGAAYVFKNLSIGYDKTDFSSAIRASAYVTKYVGKHSLFEKQIDTRVESIVNHKFADVNSFDARDFRRKLKRQVCQFHRQSIGFGLSALEKNNLDSIVETGKMFVPDGYVHTSYVSSIPVPRYFINKLFYDLIKEDGKLKWQINDDGIRYKLSRSSETIERVANRFATWYNNVPGYCPDKASLYQKHISDLLAGRSWTDFATYLLYYKGRLKSPSQLEREKSGLYQADPLDEQLCNIFYGDKQDINCIFNHSTIQDKRLFGKAWYNMNYYLDSSTSSDIMQQLDYFSALFPHIPKDKLLFAVPSVLSSSEIFSFVISDNSDPSFKNFDALFDFYAIVCYDFNLARQAAYDEKQRISINIKSLNNGQLSHSSCHTYTKSKFCARNID